MSWGSSHSDSIDATFQLQTISFCIFDMSFHWDCLPSFSASSLDHGELSILSGIPSSDVNLDGAPDRMMMLITVVTKLTLPHCLQPLHHQGLRLQAALQYHRSTPSSPTDPNTARRPAFPLPDHQCHYVPWAQALHRSPAPFPSLVLGLPLPLPPWSQTFACTGGLGRCPYPHTLVGALSLNCFSGRSSFDLPPSSALSCCCGAFSSCFDLSSGCDLCPSFSPPPLAASPLASSTRFIIHATFSPFRARISSPCRLPASSRSSHLYHPHHFLRCTTPPL